MIKVSGLTKSYGAQVLLEDVSFFINKGERIGLVGRNGHGKTTLFKIILGQEGYDSGAVIIPRHYRLGHLSQHLDFTHPTVLDEACAGLPRHEDGVDESYKVKTILNGLGIPSEWFGLSPHELSGGYQIRLNLAKVIASDPDLLLLDEPTNYLDIVSIRWLKRFLNSWRKELLLITHDRGFMDSVTTHTIAIHRKKVRKVSGPTFKLYEQIRQEEEIHEQTRVNEEKKRKEVEAFIDRFRAKATKASAVQSRVKALEKRGRLDELEEIRTLDFEFKSAPFQGKWLMEVKGLSYGYNGGPSLISGLSILVGKDDRIAVIGKNGKGKTTLLNLIAGELNPTTGSVSKNQNTKLAYFGQTNISRLNFENTIEKELMVAHPDYSREAARRICGAMMFPGDAALKKISVLSGGEKSRVLLGKILISPANLLLLDEPTNHLDMDSVDALVDAIEAFGGAVIMVTHSEQILERVPNRLIIFDKGQVTLFEGSYGDFLEKVGWEGEEKEGKAVQKANEKPSMNKKELRRLRAEVVSEKQKALAPVKSRINSVEDEITDLEEEKKRLNQELLSASQAGDGGRITSLSKACRELEQKEEALFAELEALGSRHDSITSEFEEKLGKLG